MKVKILSARFTFPKSLALDLLSYTMVLIGHLYSKVLKRQYENRYLHQREYIVLQKKGLPRITLRLNF